MHCPTCGKENADNFRYCQFCGTALSLSAIMNAIDEDDAPPASALTEPPSLDAWLIDDEPDGDPDRSGDLPLLDESNTTMIPVELSASGPNVQAGGERQLRRHTGADRISSEAFARLCKEDIRHRKGDFERGELPSDLRHLIELNDAPLSQPAGRVCKRCSAMIEEGHRFCGNCGTRYDGAYDFSPAGTPAADSSGGRVSVERINFVRNYAQPEASSPNVPFTVCHMNDNGTEGEYIPVFPGENIIGRGSTAMLSTDRYVNPKHLRIVCDNGAITAEDFKSLNGVFLKISDESVPLYNGDIFRIGEELLCYFHGNAEQPILSNRSSEPTELLGGAEADGWGYLRVILGAYSEGNVYRLSQPTVSLGRTHANILFPRDGFVSGTHATLQNAGDRAILTDLKSSNGSFVRLKAPIAITRTTFLLIGNQLIRIQPT